MAVRDFSVLTCLSHPRIKFCLKLSIITIWAALWQNQQNCLCAQQILRSACMGIHAVWSESSLSTWRKLGSLASSYPLDAERRLWSDRAFAQTDLSLGWAHSHFVGFVMRRLIYQLPSSGDFRSQWPPESRRVPKGCNCWEVCSYIDAQELLLRHMFLACNCIYKHFVETKNIVFRFEPPHDKTNKMNMRPAKTQISPGIRPVWSSSSLCSQSVAKVS